MSLRRVEFVLSSTVKRGLFSPSGQGGSGGGSASAPSAPTLNLPTGGALQVSFTWTAVAGAATYNLYQGTSPGGESGTPVATGLTGTSYTLTGLSSGTLYYFVLKAVGPGGTSAASNEVSAYTNSSLLTGLQAYYPYNTLTADVTGNGHTLTNINGVTQGSGPASGKAANFVAASNQGFSGSSFGLTPTFSVNGWYKPSSAGVNKILIGDCPSTGANGWYLQTGLADSTAATVYVNDGSVNGKAPSGTLPDATYSHIVVVYDGTQTGNANRLKIYVNSVTQSLTFTGTVPSSLTYTSAAFFIALVGVQKYNGLAAENGLWNIALSQAQITSLYGSGTPPAYPFQGVP